TCVPLPYISLLFSTAPTPSDTYTLSLHDALPISTGKPVQAQLMVRHPNFNGMQMDQITRYYTRARFIRTIDATYAGRAIFHLDRSEEHTSELQSQSNLVCRLLLEKKKTIQDHYTK